MKKLILLLLLLSSTVHVFADASQQVIQLRKVRIGHLDFPVPADMPDVYYDDAAQQIIIDGTGCVSYYDVEITSQSTWDVVVSTSVNGSYDTIDISSLPDDDYIITIDSPLGNTYEGYFTNY